MKLNDTQLILLSTGSQRGNGSLMPLPECLADAADRAKKAIAVLINKALVEEGPVNEPQFSWREENSKLFGVRITDAGRVAIGADPEPLQHNGTGAPALPAPAKDSQKKSSKSALIIELLQRDGGATLNEMVEATGWLPHTTRAALTGLRKKGHKVEKGKRGGVTCYTIKAAA